MIKEKDLPDGWKSVALGDVCNLVTDGTHEKTPLVSKEEGMPLVTSKDLVNNGICFDNVMYITKNQHNQIIKRSKPERGDILYSKIGTIGKPTIVDVNFEFSIKNVALFKLKNEIICNKYMRYYLSSDFVHNRLVKTAGGGNQKFIPLNKLKQIEIILPTIQTQKKIVAILEKAERLKEWRKEADELTDEFLKSTFLEMFGDPVTNTKGFETQKLGDISDVKSGLTLNGQRRANKNNLHPYLRVANVFRNKLDLSEIKYIHVSDSEIDKILLKKYDVLIVEGHGNIEEIGRAAVWNEDIPNCVHQNHIIRARLDEKHVQAHFLTYFLNIYGNFGYFPSKSRTTSGLNTISTNKVRKAEILSPPLELQNKFASIVQQVEQLREHQNQSKQHIDDLFNVLMQKAFKGELM